MSSLWDERHNVPIIESLDILSSWPVFDGVSKRIRIKSNESFQLPIDSLLTPGKSGCRKMIVCFHGAIDRRKVKLPRFEWFNLLAGRDEHKLFVSDTTLELSDSLALAWYLGTPEFDLSQQLRVYIEHVRKINNVDDVVLVGASGGGFAALAIGSKMKNCCSIAYSPQSDIWQFSDAHSHAYIDATFPKKETNDIKQAMLGRTDLIEMYKYGRHYNKFIYYQNTGDHEHVIKHKKRFAESLGVRLPSGRTFNQMGIFISEFDGNGHVRPPTERSDQLLDHAFKLIRSKEITLIEEGINTGNLKTVDFKKGNWKLEKIPSTWLIYSQSTPYRLPANSINLTYSENNVPLRIIDGVLYDHPVLQAQTALKALNNINYEDLKDEAIKLAEATLDRTYNYSVAVDDAIFFPFYFSWHNNKLQPPWYSAMAQGQLLQLACRTFNITEDINLLRLADNIFNSFLPLKNTKDNTISITHIDSEGYLWLEEHPYPEFNKFVLNGHIFALLGIYEYWLISQSPLAEKIFNGALLTVQRYLPDFRNRGWSSNYNLWDFLLLRNYHQTHIMQLELLYSITGDSFFSRAADSFDDDFPNYQGGGHLYLSAGKHTAYKADSTNFPTKTIEPFEFIIEEPTSLRFSIRTKMEEVQGIWLLVQEEGIYNNLWFRETPPFSFPKLCT